MCYLFHVLRGLLVQYLLDAIGRWSLDAVKSLVKSCTRSRWPRLLFPHLLIAVAALCYSSKPHCHLFDLFSLLDSFMLQSIYQCSWPIPGVSAMAFVPCFLFIVHHAWSMIIGKSLESGWFAMSMDQLG